MQIEQKLWTEESGWQTLRSCDFTSQPQLVLAFGGTSIFKDGSLLKEVADMYPDAIIAGCTTAGEIQDVGVTDDTLAITAVAFRKITRRFGLRLYGRCYGQPPGRKEAGRNVGPHRACTRLRPV